MGQQPARSITDAGCVHAILAMILECTRTGSESGRCRSTCGVFRERITSQVTSGHMWSSHQTVDCGPHILPPWAVCICQINPQIPAGITRLDQLNIFYNELSLYYFFSNCQGQGGGSCGGYSREGRLQDQKQPQPEMQTITHQLYPIPPLIFSIYHPRVE